MWGNNSSVLRKGKAQLFPRPDRSELADKTKNGWLDRMCVEMFLAERKNSASWDFMSADTHKKREKTGQEVKERWGGFILKVEVKETEEGVLFWR